MLCDDEVREALCIAELIESMMRRERCRTDSQRKYTQVRKKFHKLLDWRRRSGLRIRDGMERFAWFLTSSPVRAHCVLRLVQWRPC